MEDEDYLEEDETSLSDDSHDETTTRSRKNRKARRSKGMAVHGTTPLGAKQSMKSMMMKGKSKAKGLKSKFKNFRLGGRTGSVGYASSSDESSDVSETVRLAPTQSMYSEAPSARQVDPTLAKLEMDEFKESTTTHNMIRNNRKELLELDEMDEASLNHDPNAYSCSVFPFGLGLGAGTSSCFYGAASQQPPTKELPLDSVQMQRLKDSKHALENKPKVEVILQDLQDPMAEKYDQLEKMERKKQKEAQRERLARQQIEEREREELLQRKREMRESEQKKIQMAQNRDQLALQEAPDLNRGKSQSFVMDISDWVLNLDNNDPTPTTPKKKAAALRDNQTPRTNGRDGSTSPIEELPFSTIEVPTMASSDSHMQPPTKTQQGWRRKKKRAVSNSRPETERLTSQQLRQKNGKTVSQRELSADKKKKPLKKGWFRR